MKNYAKFLLAGALTGCLVISSFILGERYALRTSEIVRSEPSQSLQKKSLALNSRNVFKDAVERKVSTSTSHDETVDVQSIASKTTKPHESVAKEEPSEQTSSQDPDSIYDNPPVQKLAGDDLSPDSIFKPSRFTREQIKEKIEASIARLDLVTKTAHIENVSCTDEICQFQFSEKLSEDARTQLWDYYLDHPQYGKWFGNVPSKDDPSKTVYTLSDIFPKADKLGAQE